jgi:hypothetical protein
MTRKPKPEERFHISVDEKGNIVFRGKIIVNRKVLRRGLAFLLMLAGLWMASADPELRGKLVELWLRVIASLAGLPN